MLIISRGECNICKSSKLVDQWSDYCTITSIKSKIYMHNSFSGKAAQRTFQTRNEIHHHLVIVGRTIQRLLKLLAFVLLSGGSFKIDINTRITSVEVIVLKISGQKCKIYIHTSFFGRLQSQLS